MMIAHMCVCSFIQDTQLVILKLTRCTFSCNILWKYHNSYQCSFKHFSIFSFHSILYLKVVDIKVVSIALKMADFQIG